MVKPKGIKNGWVITLRKDPYSGKKRAMKILYRNGIIIEEHWLEQTFDQFGDPINVLAMNYSNFEEAWIKRNGAPVNYDQKKIIREFYDDFKHSDNQDIESYLKEIES